MATPGRRLRDAWAGGAIPVPGVFCPLVAKLAERLGFPAVYLSGAALSATLGVPDIGLVTATEFADAARAISAASPLPLLCDADTGFGEAISVERTVRLYESAGAAGLHLEDQEMPKRCGHLSGKSLVEPEVMVSKLRAAVAARVDPAFVLIARTDARGVAGFDDAVRRARLYVEAGADMVFPEALEGEEEFAAFARALPGVPLLANMTEFGRSPPIDRDRLAGLGYRIALYPVSALRAALRATERVFSDILNKGHQRDQIGAMLTRRELYELLDYDGYEERDRGYFG
ncbi:MAG: methylisocitrate lyase [Gemmataceae bacterium]